VIGSDGRLYIDDYVRDQFIVFTPDGSEVTTLPYASEHPEMVQARSDLAIGPDGRLYLLEQAGGTWIKVFEPDGTLVNEWGGTVGFEDESLFDARALAVAPDGHIFTARFGQLLQKFTNDGEFVAAWDRAGEYLFPLEVYDMEAADGALYLAVSGFRDEQSAILTLDFDGNLIAEPLIVGEGDDEDRIVPWSLAIGPDGNLFITDVFRREVIVLTPAGEELARWPLGPTDQRFPTVEVAVDDAGRVYVADDGQKVIHVYERVAGE
jgi:outer membrane protein assembly factor BamB